MAITKKKLIPLIIGLNGPYLTNEEIKIIRNNLIFGFVIFQRNIVSLIQLKNLISHINSLSDHEPVIMIDHEGGRVNRFNKIFDQKKYSAEYFSNLFLTNKKSFRKNFDFFINFNIKLFKFLGINTVAYPSLDLRYKKTHDVIGNRAFSNKVYLVKKIANLFICAYQKKGISCIAKHAPGHGLASADSHFKLPIVRENTGYLLKNDFACFNKLSSHFLMTAHIRYINFDENIATYSNKIIKLLRKEYSYKGLIMTDDICMKALKESLYKRVTQPLIAGCDIILHCNGNINEIKKITSILS